MYMFSNSTLSLTTIHSRDLPVELSKGANKVQYPNGAALRCVWLIAGMTPFCDSVLLPDGPLYVVEMRAKDKGDERVGEVGT